MLYNPNWKPETKPDVFSLESLIAWLETMPADDEYGWGNPRNCLIGQWLLSQGVVDDSMRGKMSCRLTEGFSSFGQVALGAGPYTFGAALTRARAALHG